MVIRAFGTADSCDCGIPTARVRTTMSIGFSNFVTFASTFLNSILTSAFGVCAFSVTSVRSSGGVTCLVASFGVCSLIADSVISVNGVPCREAGSGDVDGCGVGRGGCSSGASGAIDTREILLFRAVRASLTLRRLGGDFFVGEVGSSATLSGGLKIWEGSICEASTDSPVLARLLTAVRLRGVVASPAVFRLGDRTVLVGAGVKSSSSSSSCRRLTTEFSISELSSSSTITFRLAAARREGRSGDAADIATVFAALSSRGTTQC